MCLELKKILMSRFRLIYMYINAMVILTCTSFTKDQLDTNLSERRFLMGEQPRGPSLSVRPEPQHD